MDDARTLNPAIAKILNKIDKEHGVTEVKDPTLKGVFSTGCICLDNALSVTGRKIGGLPQGRIIEIFGMPGSGKTSFALSCISLYKRTHLDDKRPILIVDIERSITPEFVAGFGLSWLEDIIFVRPDTVEEALDTVIELSKTGLISFAVFDSVGAAQNARQISRSVGETDVGGISKIMHETLRELSKVCEDNSVTSIFINHITMKPGVAFGNPETTPGGFALGYYSSVRLRVSPMKPNPKSPGCGIMSVKIAKTKIGRPYLAKGNIEFDFRYGEGCDPISDMADTAKKLGILKHSAGQSRMRRDVNTEDWVLPDPSIEKTRAGYIAWLTNNPEAQKELYDLILQQDLNQLNIADATE